MDFYFIVTQLISGFTMATLLFLVASGLTLIFGVGNIFNFAHGSFYMIGAYFGYQLVSVWKVNFWIALVAAGAGAGLVGAAAEFLFLRRIYGRAQEGGFQILLTYGLILIFDDLVKLIWGTEYKSISKPSGFTGALQVGDIFDTDLQLRHHRHRSGGGCGGLVDSIQNSPRAHCTCLGG